MIGTLEDIKRDMEHGVYDFTENGECVGCVFYIRLMAWTGVIVTDV